MPSRILLASLLLTTSSLAMAAPTVVDAGPTGITREVRQVRMRFSDEMVALGDSAAPDAASINCGEGKVKAVGHWIDGRNWVGEFAVPLADGVACTVRPAALTSVKGESLARFAAWSFNTGGPRAELIDPRRDDTREEAIAIFKPSVAVDAASLRHLRCEVATNATPVTILGGARRQAVLSGWRITPGVNTADAIVAQCGSKPWPNSTQINWTWDKRISANGLTSLVDVMYRQRVRDVFSYVVECQQRPGRASCDPRGPLTLDFSEPLDRSVAQTITLHGSSGKDYPLKTGCAYTGPCRRFTATAPFQEGESVTPVFATLLHDADGRPMVMPHADRRAIQIARLPAYVGIVQGNVTLPWTPGSQARVAVATRNAEPEIAVRGWRFGGAPRDIPALLALHRMAVSNFDEVLGGDLPAQPYAASHAVLARVGGTAPAMHEQTVRPAGPAMEFVALPMSGYGSWLVEADNPRYRAALDAQKEATSYRQSARPALVQLTNLQISARLSADHPSLLWVTAIDSGKPVGGAEVELWSCDGQRLAHTVSQADGRVPFARLPATPHCDPRNGVPSDEFWIVVRNGDDICVLKSSALEELRVEMVGHTILDRVLFKAGETVSMQTLARLPVAAGFALPKPFTGKLKIYFNYNDLVDEKEVAFDAAGSATAAWMIPQTARLGAYRFTVSDTAGNTISNGYFQIEDYRMPAFDASLTGATAWHGERQDISLSASLRFLAGGAAAGQQVTLRGTYGGGGGIPGYDYRFQDLELGPLSAPPFAPRTVTLDAGGKAVISLPVPRVLQAMSLNAEMEFSDPNGEVHTAPLQLPVWPQRHKVGLNARTGFGLGLARFSVIVLDENNQPLSGQSVTIDGTEAHHVGYSSLTLPIDETARFPLCVVTTGADGKGECSIPWTRDSAPRWLFRARAQGASSASFETYPGSFNSRQRPELLQRDGAVKTQTGEPLTLTLRSPLVPATALVTVEREGVMASYVHAVVSAEQTIVVPTSTEYAPGVTVHVQVVGDAGQAMTSSAPELGNSASATIGVLFDSASHRLRVDLASSVRTARPGQTVPFEVKVRHGARAAAGAHLTLLAYDDGLTALRANFTTLVLEQFWRERYVAIQGPYLQLTWPNSVQLGKMPTWWAPGEQYSMPEIMQRMVASPAPVLATATTVKVTGQRASMTSAASLKQAGADGADSGGAGDMVGLADPRTDFSSLAVWRTDIVLDQNGEAVVAVPLKDGLTRWRIVAVAMDGADRYGTGTAYIETRKDIQVLSGLPASVRSDDTLRQKLTVRNDSEHAVTLRLRADARLVADPALPQGVPLTEQARTARGLRMQRAVILAAHQNKVIDWPLAVPDGVIALDWTISAADPAAGDGEGGDSLKVLQKVVPAAPVTVRESTIVQLDAPRSISVAQPPGARPLSGGVAVSWRASLADAAAGPAQAWMAAYPYRCMEQMVSMAVASADPAQWRQAMAQLPKFMGPDGLASYFPGTSGSEVLTAYLLDMSAAAQLPLPAPEKLAMQTALRQALTRNQPHDWLPENARLAHRLALQAAVAGDLGNAPQVVPPDLNALPTIALLDWVRHLMTLADTPDRRARLDAAAGMLRNRFDLQGTRLTWRGDSANNAWWMMWTDHVATARTAFLLQQWAALDPRWKDDVPRLVLALADQQRQGHWDTTVANAWALTALRGFARANERGPVTGVSHAVYGGASAAQHWPRDEPALLAWAESGRAWHARTAS